MEPTKDKITLEQLPIGARLLVRSRVDWRLAAVSKRVQDRVILTVCSPNGRTYGLKRDLNSAVTYEGNIPILLNDDIDSWHDNFGRYDVRW